MAESPIPTIPKSSGGAGPSSSSGSVGRGSGFNWAKNLTSESSIPESTAPVTIPDSGRPRVKVSNEVFERGAKLHSYYIVGIFYGKPPSYGKIWGVLNYLWGKDKRVSIHNLTRNAFLFHIPSPVLRKLRLTLHGMPFDLITPEGLGIACRPLGRAVAHKPFTSINSAEVKVIVDLTKPLPTEIELERDDGNLLLLTVTYPWLPPLCSICGEIGHKDSLCPRVYGPENKPSRPARNHLKTNSSSQSQTLPKETGLHKEKKSAWKQVVSDPRSSSASDKHVASVSEGLSQDSVAMLVSAEKSSTAIVPVNSPSLPRKAHQEVKGLSDKISMDLVIADTTFSPPQKPLLPKATRKSSSLLIETSNSFDILKENSQALTIPERSVKDTLKTLTDEALSTAPMKKRKVNSSPLLVSGLNEVSKHRPLRNWLYSKSVSFGALLETHVGEVNSTYLLSAIGPQWSLLSNYEFSELGRIWIIYKDPVGVRVLFKDQQSITCEISVENEESFIFKVVYASNLLAERQLLWESLKDTCVSFQLMHRAWIVVGDFNETMYPFETSNPNIYRTTRGMRDFADCLAASGLFDLPFNGPHYTWSNHRIEDPIAKKLDRCLVNGSWLLRFSRSHCSFEAPEFSDHSPCHIRLVTPPPAFGSRPFRFFNLLTKHRRFQETVQSSWSEAGESVRSLRDFCFKLKRMKRPLKSLLKDNYSDIERRVSEALSALSSLQLASLADPSESNLLLESQAKDLWLSLRAAEESFFRQRSRIRWLGEGDLNTKFFHSVTTTRNAKNAIRQLIRADGTKTTTLQQVHELAVAYYTSFLTTIRGVFLPDLPRLLESLVVSTCSSLQQGFLSLPFNSEMVKQCLFKMPLNKTPGPDGFPAPRGIYWDMNWNFQFFTSLKQASSPLL
ncbi:unnamed protein product [Microthlaspi erraticum]|uniref:DUF4283 domain-containing protein n=1 Tax=Microthlaspi erraticum TaxID=1685480 RepID=A0A6D2I658_9BRAS|nr:unnamed protein product [Microthlaspi erraticum]